MDNEEEEECMPLIVPNRKTVIRSINLEMMRFLGYAAVFVMLFVGKLITDFYVEWPVKGEPFKPEKTFIYQLYGFNHTCTVIDFNPSRTICALLVIFAIVPLSIYVVLNRIRIEHDFLNGNVGPKLYKFNKIITPIQLIGFVFFYMVFVNQPIDLPSLVLHSIPFINYQIALTLNEIQQIEYLIQRKQRGLPLPYIIEKLPKPLMRLYSLVVILTFVLYTTFVLSSIAGSPIIDTSNDAGLAFCIFLMYFYQLICIVLPMISSFFLVNSKYGSDIKIQFTTMVHKLVEVPSSTTQKDVKKNDDDDDDDDDDEEHHHPPEEEDDDDDEEDPLWYEQRKRSSCDSFKECTKTNWKCICLSVLLLLIVMISVSLTIEDTTATTTR